MHDPFNIHVCRVGLEPMSFELMRVHTRFPGVLRTQPFGSIINLL